MGGDGRGDRFGSRMGKGWAGVGKVKAGVNRNKEGGTMAALHKKWLGADADPATATVKVMEIPQAQ